MSNANIAKGNLLHVCSLFRILKQIILITTDTAARHIPKCKTITNRPKPPRSTSGEEGLNGLTESHLKSSKVQKRLDIPRKVEEPQESRPFTQYNPEKSTEKAADVRSTTIYQKSLKKSLEKDTQKTVGVHQKLGVGNAETHRPSMEYAKESKYFVNFLNL